MGYRVKGTLKLPDGGSAQGLKVEFTAGSTSQTVLAGTKYTMAIGVGGAYDIDLEFGSYSVLGYVDGAYPLSMGSVVVDATTATGQTLTQLLGGTSDVPAAWIAQIEQWLAASKAEADRAKSEADRAKREADRAKEIANLDTVEDAVALSAVPFPDVWIPFNDSLNMLAGYGTEIKVGTDVVASKVDFTRASAATYIDKSGVLRTASINEPRFEKDGLLIEGQSTNLITTSATLTTSTVTVAAGSYTLSFYGAGSVTLSGAATGVLTGTAADKRVSLTVAATAGALTLTVAGTCSNAQLEALPFATSYIPTSGAAATRASDRCIIPQCGNLPDVSGSDYFIALTCKLYPQADSPYRFLFRTGDIPAVSAGMVFGSSLSNTSMRMYTGSVNTGYATQPIVYGQQTTYGSGLNNKRAVSLGPAGVNRSSVDFTPVEHSKDDFLNGKLGIGCNFQGNYMYGHIRNFRIWHRALTDEQIKALK